MKRTFNKSNLIFREKQKHKFPILRGEKQLNSGKMSHMARLNAVAGDWFGWHFENGSMTLGGHLLGNKEQNQEGDHPPLWRCFCYSIATPVRKVSKAVWGPGGVQGEHLPSRTSPAERLPLTPSILGLHGSSRSSGVSLWCAWQQPWHLVLGDAGSLLNGHRGDHRIV